MAEELGLSPRSLIKNIPSPKQQWKALDEDWVREMYEKLYGAIARREVLPKDLPPNSSMTVLSQAINWSGRQ